MILMINNEAIPSPSKLYVVYSDIKTDEQNAAGGTVTDYVATFCSSVLMSLYTT